MHLMYLSGLSHLLAEEGMLMLPGTFFVVLI